MVQRLAPNTKENEKASNSNWEKEKGHKLLNLNEKRQALLTNRKHESFNMLKWNSVNW